MKNYFHKFKTELKSFDGESYAINKFAKSKGIIYADTFTTDSRICLTKIDEASTNLLVYVKITFIEKPIFVIKSITNQISKLTLKE